MSNRKNKQSLIGKVVSAKMQNTVSVEVARVIAHPVYKKRIKKHNFYLQPTLSINLTASELYFPNSEANVSSVLKSTPN